MSKGVNRRGLLTAGALLGAAPVLPVAAETVGGQGMPWQANTAASPPPTTPGEGEPTFALPPPGPYETVMNRDLIVLCDADAECLTVPQRAMIQDFVKAGGGLLLVGGPFAFGRGAMERSELLEPLLPVTIPGFEDLKPLAQAAPLQPDKNSRVAMKGLDWKASPLVMWMHQAQAKQGATVELTAGGQPALVTWEYGKGRVAALSATVLGEPPAGGMAFWDWPDWPNCMERVVRWLLPRK